VLVRCWNLYHGNSSPPGRVNRIERMVRLASADRPDVLCLQEVPAWALHRLADWSGLTVVGDVAQRPAVGPLPSTARIGKALTACHPGLFRSAFAGQANAILTSFDVLGRWRAVLNPRDVRRGAGVDALARLAWAKERRICQAVRVRLPDGRTAVVANLHATGGDPAITRAEIDRGTAFATGLAAPDEPVVLAGDFNHAPDLAGFGFDAPGPGIDHILVRGATAGELRAWPEDRRRIDGAVHSDHAPVEREVG
jgi:endonuclease/exonuclease/phosphatase family metal-dependent hydrolase